METLAVVAYRQPVLRTEIEAIRGVQSGEVLRQLIERNLVRIAGRSEELGRPFLYGTTRQFLQVFGLRHLDELPRADALRPGNLTPTADNNIPNCPDSNFSDTSTPSQIAAEEENVKTLTTKAQRVAVQDCFAPTTELPFGDRPIDQDIVDKYEDEEQEEDEDLDDEDDDFEDEEDFDDEEEEDEEEDEDLDDEPWEEVDDDEEDEDWDEDDDEDWDDEDWDEDEDWGEDKDKDKEEEEEPEDE
jgi:segregation and condensation protein B